MTNYFKKIRNFFTSEKMIFSLAISYQILAFLTFTFVTAEVKYLKYLSYVIVIWGFVIIFFSLFRKDTWNFNLKSILAICFILSFILSSIFMYKYGISENLKGFIWLSVELLVLFLLNKGNINSRFLKYFMICFVFIATLYAAISVSMAVVDYMHYPTSTTGDMAAGGMAHGRLFGMYSDPNYGCTSSILAILCLTFLLHDNKTKFNIFVSIIIALIQTIYISLSGSRSGLIAFVIAIFIVSFLIYKTVKANNLIKSLILSLLISGCCFGICFSIQPIYEIVEPQILKALNGPITNPMHTYTVQFADKVREECGLTSPYINNNGTDIEEQNNEISYKHGEVNSEHIGLLGRSENEDLSNNRLTIWKSGLEMFLKSPIIGLSNRNYTEFCIDNYPDSYLAKAQWQSMHNSFIDVLISQGAIGIIIWVSMLLFIFITIINNIIKHKNDIRYIAILAIFVSMMTMCMFFSELLYVNTIGSVFFWYTFGHLDYNKVIKQK